jgi:hypothetical protein
MSYSKLRRTYPKLLRDPIPNLCAPTLNFCATLFQTYAHLPYTSAPPYSKLRRTYPKLWRQLLIEQSNFVILKLCNSVPA